MSKTDKMHNNNAVYDKTNNSTIRNDDDIAQQNTNDSSKIICNDQHRSRTNPKLLSKRLKQLRNEKQLTQQSLATQIGVTKQIVSRWESSDSFMSISKKNLKKLAAFLICSEDYLTGVTDKKNAYLEGDETICILGMGEAFVSEIRCRIRFYSYKQREFLYEFLHLFETLSPTQLEMLKRFTIVIASSNIPTITNWHPLFKLDSFHKIFIETKHMIDEAKIDLSKHCKALGNGIPENVERALNNLSNSIEKDYYALSEPLQSKNKFKNSLKNLTESINFFIESLQGLYNTKNRLKSEQEHFSSILNDALDKDIDFLFHLLKNNYAST